MALAIQFCQKPKILHHNANLLLNEEKMKHTYFEMIISRMTIENTLSHLHAILMLIKWGNKSYIVNNKECLSTNLAKKVYLNIVLHKVHYSALRK